MKLLLVAVKDLAINAYQAPATVRATQEAIRGFTGAVNNPQAGHIFSSPADFELWHIGYFDETNGEVTTLAPMERLTRGSDVKQN